MMILSPKLQFIFKKWIIRFADVEWESYFLTQIGIESHKVNDIMINFALLINNMVINNRLL